MAEITLDKKIELIQSRGYADASYPAKLTERFLSLPLSECIAGLPVTCAVVKSDFPGLMHASMLEACAELRRMKIRHDKKYQQLRNVLGFAMKIKGELSDSQRKATGSKAYIAMEEEHNYLSETISSAKKASASERIASIDAVMEVESVIKRFMHLKCDWMQQYLESHGADMYQADELWKGGYRCKNYLYEAFEDASYRHIERGFLMPAGSLIVKEDAYAEEKAKRQEYLKEMEEQSAPLSMEEHRHDNSHKKFRRPSSQVQKQASSRKADILDPFLLMGAWTAGIALMVNGHYGLSAVIMVVLANVFMVSACIFVRAVRFFTAFNGILAGAMAFMLFHSGIESSMYLNGILVLAVPAAAYILTEYASCHKWPEAKLIKYACLILAALAAFSFLRKMVPCGIILCILLFMELTQIYPDKK